MDITTDPFLHLVIGLLACFIGTIPFGPINLTVVKTTVDKNARQGMKVALAASFVELFHSLIAIVFGMAISDFLTGSRGVNFFLAALFVTLALVIWRRKPKPELHNDNSKDSSFKNGFLIAFLNPQAIPFWIFALATISQYFTFQYTGICLTAFLVGVFLGKLAALSSFVVASGYLKQHLQESSLWVNRLLAVILLFIGVSQLWEGFNG